MDDPDENAGDEPPPGNVKKKNLTGGQVKQIVSQLLLLVKEGDENHSLKYGALKKVANNFNVTWKAISKIWKRARESFDDPDIAAFRASPRKHLSGRKLKWNRDEVRDAVREVPFQSKRNLRCLSAALGIPLTSLHRMKEDKMDAVIVPHTNAVKPHLHDHHKLARVFYSVSKLDLAVDKWTDFYDSVHVDEKWFFITEAQLHMYLAPNEEAPHRTVGHKSHILKVMFLCAVARPRYNAQGECIAQVLRAYDEFDPRKIEFGFLTLQCCLDEIMCSNGSNQYKIPHMNKARLLREGTLPTRVTASQQAVLSAKAILGLD